MIAENSTIAEMAGHQQPPVNHVAVFLGTTRIAASFFCDS